MNPHAPSLNKIGRTDALPGRRPATSWLSCLNYRLLAGSDTQGQNFISRCGRDTYARCQLIKEHLLITAKLFLSSTVALISRQSLPCKMICLNERRSLGRQDTDDRTKSKQKAIRPVATDARGIDRLMGALTVLVIAASSDRTNYVSNQISRHASIS